jgi:putative Ca2+/H+ antiporter (TMEM165/GDT1 family)
VFAAAAGALVLSTGLAVVVGSQIAGWFAPHHLRVAAGIGFLTIGAWMLLSRG